MARPNLAAGLGSGVGSGYPAHISIKNSRFTMVDSAGARRPVETFDPQKGPYIDCVIVDVNQHVSRRFRFEAYDENNPKRPDCFSDNGVAPSVEASSPQHVECGTCPQAVWGSAISKKDGKGIPACQETKKIAILIPGMGDMVFLLTIPPNSLKPVKAYSQKIAALGIDACDIVTRIWFLPGINGTLSFDATEYADDATKALVDKIWEGGGCPNVVGRNDQPRIAAPVQEVKPLPSIVAPMQQEVKPLRSAAAEDAPLTLEPKKPRGRPRTVVDAPKNSLEAPFKPQQTVAQVTPFPAPQQAEQGKFGITQNAPEPNPQLSSQLESLFSTKFGN
jgi:hypothetical protein